MIAGLERIAPGWGGADGQPSAEGFYIFEVSEPTAPKRVGHFKTGSTGTHRNFYDGGNIVHAAAGATGLSGKIYRSIDISHPGHPTLMGLDGFKV